MSDVVDLRLILQAAELTLAVVQRLETELGPRITALEAAQADHTARLARVEATLAAILAKLP